MDEEFEIRYLLNGVVRSLVKYPDEVQILRLPCDTGFAFEIHVHPSDRPSVVGPKGQTAKALRVVAGGATRQTRAGVNLISPGESLLN